MRWLANENVPRQSVEALRKSGHEVAWIREDAAGSTDPEVLAKAIDEDRVLLTLDKDFGELAFRAGLPSNCGVLLLRISPPHPPVVTATLEALLASEQDFRGEFVVVTTDRIRRRALPQR